MNHSEIVSFIWGVADLIRDTFKRGKYEDVIPADRAQDILKIVADFKDGDTRTVTKDGKQEEAVVNKVFPTTHFGFRKITVEHPLRLNFQASASKRSVVSWRLRSPRRRVVDAVHRGEPVATSFRARVEHLIELGVLERVGRGRGVRLLLSRRFYRHLGKSGVYTRKRALDRDTNKTLLLRHIEESGEHGAPFQDLVQSYPRSRGRRSSASCASFGTKDRSRWRARSEGLGGFRTRRQATGPRMKQ